jgi:predicted phage terminase large subunit-like protein
MILRPRPRLPVSSVPPQPSSAVPISINQYPLFLRADLVSFIQATFYELNPQTRYMPAAHIEVIAGKLMDCMECRTRRLIINVPPRHLKSICVTIAFVAFLLGHKPAARVICASYGQDLADKFARDTKTVMLSTWYQALFKTHIMERQAAHDITTDSMGNRLATSVGGVLTGRGADFIILDDPLKPEEALSETQRTSVNDWYNNTLLSRLDDKAKGCIIIVMQRLHQDDLVGHVLEQDDWEVLSFPAIAEVEERHLIEGPLGKRMWIRQPGEPLHPERESLVTLADIRRRTTEYNFASQYQQNPTPPGGALVKAAWLQFYDVGSQPARFSYIAQSWDTANKAGELNDYSVCTTWGVHGKILYLLHVYRRKLNFPDLKRAVIAQKNLFRANYALIEDRASGTQLIQEMKGQGVNVRPYDPPPGNDKLMRLHAQSIYFENGRVFLPREAPWLAEYIAELTGFPGTRYDDQVDSTTQFLDHFGTHGSPMIIPLEAQRRAAMPGPYSRWRNSLIPCFF